MDIRTLETHGDHAALPSSHEPPLDPACRWRWIDIRVGPDDMEELLAVTSSLELDALAVRGAVEDRDLPKLDDFGTSLLVILHGLAADRIEISEVDCFVSERMLVTVHQGASPAIETLWVMVQQRAELTSGGPDELVARLADVSTRRLMSALDTFDDGIEDLIERALDADGDVVSDVTAIRGDLATLRRSVHPQRELLDLLRRSTSPLLSDVGRRRFSDVFDVASRAGADIDAARTALTETLDAYRGAEARQATEVTKVLTIYAAIMMPLTLVVGFFSMNFANLPGIHNDRGWVIVTAAMAAGTVLSLGVFVALGWIRRPSGREAGSALGHGLVESARAPAQLVGAAFEISIMPLRTIASIGRRHDHSQSDQSDA